MTAVFPSLLHWTPRAVGLAFVLFLAMFALDVFGETRGIGQTAIALAIHLLPAAIALAVVAVAWRWPLAGGVLLILAGLAYTNMVVRSHPFSWVLVIAGPAFLTGGLFIADWLTARRRSASRS